MFFLEKRVLKKEIESLDKKLEAAIYDRNSADKRSAGYATKINAMSIELTNANDALAKTAKLVRDQTGADLLVNALKELGVIPLAEKEPDHFAESVRLNNQAAAMRAQSDQNNQSAYYSQSSLGNIFGGGFG